LYQIFHNQNFLTSLQNFRRVVRIFTQYGFLSDFFLAHLHKITHLLIENSEDPKKHLKVLQKILTIIRKFWYIDR
jgi:hypothetical protein